jgi:hypothetical protein
MPTINCPALVFVPSICRSNASAGGQLEHPSEVKSSTSTIRGPGLVSVAATGVVVCANAIAGKPVIRAIVMPVAIRLDSPRMNLSLMKLPIRRRNKHRVTTLFQIQSA